MFIFEIASSANRANPSNTIPWKILNSVTLAEISGLLSDLVNTKTTIPLRVAEERWVYTSTLRVSVYIHHYSPPLRRILVY